MRAVHKIEYVVKKESDVDETNIYAFSNKKDISFLCRKDNEFFWKPLCSTNRVWYDKYKTIEKAIDGIVKMKEYKERNYGAIMEFDNLQEFIVWAHKEVSQ